PADSLEKLLIAEQVDSNKIKLQLQLFAFYYMNDAAKENHYLKQISDLIDKSNTISSDMIYKLVIYTRFIESYMKQIGS
ncbi:MAG: hypothetical protein RBT49_12265, partial [Bacteroidales bacterium]|nr:hypothetical protein [Bacteroidales bacterium]